jgi:hypothetical protein
MRSIPDEQEFEVAPEVVVQPQLHEVCFSWTLAWLQLVALLLPRMCPQRGGSDDPPPHLHYMNSPPIPLLCFLSPWERERENKEYKASSSGASSVFLMGGGRRRRQADQIIEERRLPQCISCRLPLSCDTRHRRRCNAGAAGPAIVVAPASGRVIVAIGRGCFPCRVALWSVDPCPSGSRPPCISRPCTAPQLTIGKEERDVETERGGCKGFTRNRTDSFPFTNRSNLLIFWVGGSLILLITVY